MKKLFCIAVIALLGLLLAAPGWSQVAGNTESPLLAAQLSESSSDEALVQALADITERLTLNFTEARPQAVEWIQDTELPAQFRSEVLQSAIDIARSSGASDFETEAGPAYRELVELLQPGGQRAKLHSAYGNLMIARGRFDLAEAQYRLALEESDDTDIGALANLRNSLGVALAQQGRLDEALEEMLQSYRLFEQTETGPANNLLRNIGGLSIYLENWEQAIRFSQIAIEQFPPNDPASVGIRSNLAAAFIAQGNFEAAQETLETAIAIGDEAGQPSSSAISNLGALKQELGQPEEALPLFERAAELNRVQNDPSSLAISIKNIGDTLILLDRREEAAEMLLQSLSLYREADIKPKRLELYPVLVDNLEQLGRYPEALAAMREYRELSEEMASADARTRVAELQTAFDLERRDRELAESERERLSRESQLFALQSEQAMQRLVRWALLVGLAALTLFLLLLMRSLWSRTRANRLLAEKNAEIEDQRTALSQSNAQLHRHSIEDELTKLGNRRSVRQLIDSDGSLPLLTKPSLLILIDLDRFKGINDRFGHAAGDQILSQFADVLREVAGPEDILVRWGGEEFLWLVANTGIEHAYERCRSLAERVKATSFEASGRRLSITCSMGVAAQNLTDGQPQQAFDLALKVADAALYEAKTEGRNRWVGFDRRVSDTETFAGSLDITNLVSIGALSRIEKADQ